MEQKSEGIIVSLTEKAADEIAKAMEKENKKGYGLRFGVTPGGCSGYMYDISFEKSAKENDTVVEEKGIKIFIDSASVDFVKGSKIDYVKRLQNSGFDIQNPNVKRKCGCGHSVG